MIVIVIVIAISAAIVEAKKTRRNKINGLCLDILQSLLWIVCKSY